jgi:hypothetical protein
MELLTKVLIFLTINCIIIQIGAQYQYRDPFREQIENYAEKQIEFYKQQEKSKFKFFDHNFTENISFLFSLFRRNSRSIVQIRYIENRFRKFKAIDTIF